MYSDLQQRYVRRVSAECNSAQEGHDYDHIEEEKYMFTFPTSSADLALEIKTKKEGCGCRDEEEEEEEEEEEGKGEGFMGVSLVPGPQTSLYYSLPVECDRTPFTCTVNTIQNSNACCDYEDIAD